MHGCGLDAHQLAEAGGHGRGCDLDAQELAQGLDAHAHDARSVSPGTRGGDERRNVRHSSRAHGCDLVARNGGDRLDAQQLA